VGALVLDAYALIAYLRGEPAGAEVSDLLRRERPPSISAVNLAEVIDRLVRVDRRSGSEVRSKINFVIAGGMEVEPVWHMDARRAGTLRAQHYVRRSSELSLADCICVATAMKLDAALATSDPVLARTARAEGVEVIALPDSKGNRP
jgi:PIN domain nuclease of toxin-antitoxin system